MPRVNLDAIQPGDVLAEDVRNFHGQLLLAAGTTLDQRHLLVLRAWGVAAVRIASDESSHDILLAADAVAAEALRRRLEERFRPQDRDHPLARCLVRLGVERRLQRGQR